MAKPLPQLRATPVVNRADRQQQVMDLTRQGYPLSEIVKIVGVSHTTVLADRKKALQALHAETTAMAGEYRDMLIARLESLYKVMGQAAEQGDARAANVARQCAMDIAKLLGLDILKAEISGPGGGPIAIETDPVIARLRERIIDGELCST